MPTPHGNARSWSATMVLWRLWRWRRTAPGWPPVAADGRVRIWSTEVRQEQATAVGRTVGVTAVAADGTWLATGGEDGRVRVWDTATGQERMSWKGHVGRVHAAAVAPDGSWLATGGSGEDGTARVWAAETGQERAVLTGFNGGVEALAAADGGWLLDLRR